MTEATAWQSGTLTPYVTSGTWTYLFLNAPDWTWDGAYRLKARARDRSVDPFGAVGNRDQSGTELHRVGSA